VPLSDPQSARIGAEDDSLAPRKVTTFVIQREDEEQQTASIEQPKPEPEADTVSEIIQSSPAATPASDATLVAGIQRELARRGFYDGPADGKTGPKTSAAILRFEKQAGRPETGSASDTLLAALQGAAPAQNSAQQMRAKAVAAAKPAQRPYENVKGGKGELDPVAAAIRNAEIDPQYIPKVDIPASSELVMNIQKGLTNLAYSDVSVDGVAGEQTRTAIRHFEKHYRLPETGQPSDKVLKKMKEIGAL
jgi:peptidoglycan hydrolase-like protein with peptidoglycan-binding domain